jgi:hypothetical protein
MERRCACATVTTRSLAAAGAESQLHVETAETLLSEMCPSMTTAFHGPGVRAQGQPLKEKPTDFIRRRTASGRPVHRRIPSRRKYTIIPRDNQAYENASVLIRIKHTKTSIFL